MTDLTASTDTTWRRACAASLAGLYKVGPARLAIMMADHPPEVAWEALGEGAELSRELKVSIGPNHPAMRKHWKQEVKRTDPLEVLGAYDELGIDVWTPFGEYPESLLGDPWAPPVLFTQGDLKALRNPRVGIVGTRRCTHEGAETAKAFGVELSEAGISVVSGLALGIDGAAHRGALEASKGAPPIAVVGNGLDRVYPMRHRQLWEQVRSAGLIISETPLKMETEAWRFPARNRVIAALSDVLVVVESHEHGGSLLTANEALARDVPVMAVPGSVRNPAARGTNALLRDGSAPACCIDDILVALSLEPIDHGDGTLPLEDSDIPLLEALGWDPVSTDEVLLRIDLPLGEVAVGLARLERDGWIESQGGWWQRLVE